MKGDRSAPSRGEPSAALILWRRLAPVAGVALAYYFAARLGLLLKLPGTNSSPVWPPSGIGLAAVLLLGLRVWPGILAGAFLANLLTLPGTLGGLTAAAAIAVGNTLEHVVAYLLIKKFIPSSFPFERSRDVLHFALAACLGCAVASIIGAGSLVATGIVSYRLFWPAWYTWWLGDLVGILVLTPALLCWRRAPRLGMSPSRLLELALLAGLITLAAELLFGGWIDSPIVSLPYMFIVPGLLWAAFRFGPRETATLAVLLSFIAVTHTWRAAEEAAALPAVTRPVAAPFLSPVTSISDSLLLLQVFICVLAVTAIILGAAVHERAMAERLLSESERRFRTIFEQAAVGVALIETATDRVVRINRRFCDLVGFSVEKMITTSFQAITHPDDLPTSVANMSLLVAGEIGEFTMKTRYFRKDGSIVWVKLNVSPTWRPGEKPEHYIAVVEDISKRLSAEEALRQSEGRFRSVVAAAPNGMVMIDRDGTIVLANAQMEKLFGYGAGELDGQALELLVPRRFREPRPIYRNSFFSCPRTGNMGAGRELFGLRKDGSEFPVEIGLNPLHTEAGLFVLASVIDISERKQKEATQRRFEDELRRARAELEVKVQNRTFELIQVNFQLKQSLQEKEILLKEIHHRVKNNLQVISSLLQLQGQHTPDAKSMEMFRESRNRVRSMALVHERLYHSPDLTHVDFAAYIRGLASYLLGTYQVNNDLIKLHFDACEFHLGIDAAVPCGLIVNELLSNCLKHAFPGGGGEIRIGLHCTEAGRAVVSVSDNGVGLPEDLDFPNAATFGMRLIAALVDQLRGWIEVERREGTSVCIMFPLQVQPQWRADCSSSRSVSLAN